MRSERSECLGPLCGGSQQICLHMHGLPHQVQGNEFNASLQSREEKEAMCPTESGFRVTTRGLGMDCTWTQTAVRRRNHRQS